MTTGLASVGTLLSNGTGTLWNSWMPDYAMLCYSMLLSLSAEELVQESDQCRQVTQIEMESLLRITWLFKSNCNCSLIEYQLDQY